jgi:hypothetical protein
MSSEELNDLPELLRRLQPSAAALDRDRLMFQAGQAQRPALPRVWLWQLATAISSLLAVGLGLVLLLQPTPQPQGPEKQDQTSQNPQEKPPSPPPSLPARPPESEQPDWPDSPYYRLQEQLSRWGRDAVPPPPPAAPSRRPATLEELLKDLDPWSTSLLSSPEDH